MAIFNARSSFFPLKTNVNNKYVMVAKNIGIKP